MTPRRMIAAFVPLLLLALLAPPSAGAREPGCGATACASLTVVVGEYPTGVRPSISLVAADDPERLDGIVSLSSDGVARIATVKPGSYKLVLNRAQWWGGASHATARVITLRAGESRRISVSKLSAGSALIDVNDARGDKVPYVRTVVRSKRDPAQIISMASAAYPPVRFSATALHESTVDFVDLTGRNATLRTEPWRIMDRSVRLRSASGADPVHSGYTSGSALLTGKIEVEDYYAYAGRVSTQLFRADTFHTVVAQNNIYSPEDAENVFLRNLAPGAYKLRYSDGLWYGGTSHATATTINVGGGETIRITDSISRRGDLVGIVRSDRGVPLNDVLVRLYRKDQKAPIAYALTSTYHAGDGSYLFGGLPDAEYQIAVSDPNDRLVARWFGGSASRATAATIRPELGVDRKLADLRVLTGLRATASPVVTGSPKVGSTLTAGTTRWSVPRVSGSRQWLRDGKEIKGATGPKYRLTSADRGHRISVRTRAVVSQREPASARSASTAVVR